MNYRANFSGARFFRSPIVILLSGLILVWLLGRPPVYRLGERLALTLARPFWSLGAAGLNTLGRVRYFFSARAELIAEIGRLNQIAANLETNELERQRLTLDNQRLREIFNRRAATTPRPVTMARVLTRPNQSPTGALIVDLGSANTVMPLRPGDLAVSENAAIGEISAVYDRTAKIELYSSWGKKIEALIGPDRITAEARGRGGGNYLVSLPRDLALKVGDPVFVSRAGAEYGLGEVRVIMRDPSDAFQEILFRSPVNLELLSWLEIYGS